MRKLFTSALAALLLTAGLARADEARDRRAHYLSAVPERGHGAFWAIAMIRQGKEISMNDLRSELLHVRARRDCSDFIMAGFLRLLYLHRDTLAPEVREALEKEVVNFKYWIDEPGKDSMCYWSENHQILFHSDEYLAGAMFPDTVFPNSGMTGRQHMEKAERLIGQWMSWRGKFGYSEWLSNVYFDEDLYPLLNLVDFALDAKLKLHAAMQADQIALNLALNNFRGQVRGTHGRTYEKNLLESSGDDTRQAVYLLFGLRPFTEDMKEPSKSGVALATSAYQLPEAIYKIGSDTDSTFENYQAHGVDIAKAPEFGIFFDDPDSLMFFWGGGMYAHPLVIDLTVRMWKEWDLEDNLFFLGLPRLAIKIAEKRKIGPMIANAYIASEGAFLHDSHTYSYRTPDYMLASALDYRPRKIGAQNLPWSATLGQDAFVFVNYPGSIAFQESGGWTGNGSNPRVGQYKNVLAAIYDAPLLPSLGESPRKLYTHAWLPRKAFDEVRREGHWTFARKDKGYVALYSHNPVELNFIGPYAGNELIAWGRRNIWLCEMGREETSGSFEAFISSVLSAAISVQGTSLRYDSPSLGRFDFGMEGPLTVAGNEIPLRRDLRYDNPFVRAPRFSEKLQIECKGKTLVLDYANGERTEGVK